jgi:hypothetical protein
MATRDDVRVRYSLSPRIVYVDPPSTEISIQDLHDTLRDIEDEPGNLGYDDLIETEGKAALGGGTTVGLTATLQDARLAFVARKTSVSSGTITAADPTGTTLVDGAANFVADAVQPGAWIVNLTDGSVGSVIAILSATSLLTDGLGDGIDNGFGIADAYKIWNVIQCEVLGGNLVAVDAADAEIDPILPTAGTQIVRTASSSATITSTVGDVAAIVDAVWAEPAAGQAPGSLGEVLVDLPSAAENATAVWATPVAGQPAGSMGEKLDSVPRTRLVLGAAAAGTAPNQVVEVMASLVRDGVQVVSGLVSATVTMRTHMGAIVFGPDPLFLLASGFFRRSWSGLSLSDGETYYLELSITDAIGSVSEYFVAPTVGLS